MRTRARLFLLVLAAVLCVKILEHFWKNQECSFRVASYLPLYWGFAPSSSDHETRLQSALETRIAALRRQPTTEPPPVPVAFSGHVLLLVTESLRSDAISPRTTPFLDSLSRNSIASKDHFSTANCTPFSVFSIVTGQWPSQYPKVDQSDAFPTGLAALYPHHERWTGNGVSWTYWNQQSTLFKGFRDLLAGTAGNTPDTILFERYLAMRDTAKRPTLTVLMLNTTHYNYEVDPANVVEPDYAGPDFDFRKVDRTVGARLHARYTNAVHLLDHRMRTFFRRLQETGGLDSTIVLFTGDHGEEFFETGRLTHSLDPNGWESKVPLFIHWKGFHEEIGFPTSHHQIPSLLAAIARDSLVPWKEKQEHGGISLVFNSIPMPGRPNVAGLLKGDRQLVYMRSSDRTSVRSPTGDQWSSRDLDAMARLIVASGLAD